MKTQGIHHVSSLVADIRQSYPFYHEILGLKLTMKTVNQEDTSMYHIFFGDETGREGTEYTLFEMKNQSQTIFGTNSIERTIFLLTNDLALEFWINRFDKNNICHYGLEQLGEKTILRFEDPFGMQLGFMVDETQANNNHAYLPTDIPKEYAIASIGAVQLRVRYAGAILKQFSDYFGFEVINQIEWNGQNVCILSTGQGNFQQELHIIEDKKSSIQKLGTSGIHHLAFGVSSVGDLYELEEKLINQNVINSGIKNREFMQSTYFREPNYNLIEVATPIIHEQELNLNQQISFDELDLYLPGDFEKHRVAIEASLEN